MQFSVFQNSAGDWFEQIVPVENLEVEKEVSADVFPPGTTVTTDLLKEFADNAVAATDKYRGQTLVVGGEVIEADMFFGDPYIALGTGVDSSFSSVWCMLSDMSKSQGVPAGNLEIVRGTFSEWDGYDVLLRPYQVGGGKPEGGQGTVDTATPGESEGLKLLTWEVMSQEYGLLTIAGVVENSSDELKEGLYITFDVYDKSGYSLGTADAAIDRLQAGKNGDLKLLGWWKEK